MDAPVDKEAAALAPTKHASPVPSARASSVRASASVRSAAAAVPDHGRLLWGQDPLRSGSLAYVRAHAARMVRRVDGPGAPRFVLHKNAQDVRVYRRVPLPVGGARGAAGAAGDAALGSSRASATAGDALADAAEEDEDGDWGRVTGHFELRAVTRVAGSPAEVAAALSPVDPREVFRVAAQTQRNVRVAAASRAERVPGDASGDTAWWSLQYLRTKFVKHSRTMDAAFSELAAVDAHGRRAFVYRRSVDARALGSASAAGMALAAASTAAATASADERAERFLLQDWLLDARETDAPGVSKLVLTTRVLFAGADEALRRSMRLEFREFATHYMVAARRLLAARRDAHTSQTPVTVRVCDVCASGFSLLRARHLCRGCGASVCAKCCAAWRPPAGGAVSSAGLLGADRASGAGRKRRGDRECVLCARFGPPSARRSSASTASRVVEAPASLSVLSTDDEDVDEDEDAGDDLAAPDLLLASSSRGFAASSSSRGTGAGGRSSATQLQPQARRKFRSDSTDSSRSSPGIVLLSDIESLSLAGGFRRVSSASSASSGSAASSFARGAKRPDRAASEDNLFAPPSTGGGHAPPPSDGAAFEDEPAYSEDDLANFTLELAP